MDKQTKEALGKAGKAVGQETKKALGKAGKQTGKFMQKRRTLPTWALLLILAVFVVMIALPDQGSYYYKVQEPTRVPVGTQPTVVSRTIIGPIAQVHAQTVQEPTEMRGIDVSKWQGVIDWVQVAESDVEFAIIKATEGTTYVDPYFVANWDGARAAGVLVSAYHMLWPTLSAEKQAAHFLATLGERNADLPLALDVEKAGSGNIGAVVEAWLVKVAEADGRKPFIYTAQAIWNKTVGMAPGWHEYPLWVADYDAASPAMPAGWDTWTCWQHSSTGKVAGISGNTDMNVCTFQ